MDLDAHELWVAAFTAAESLDGARRARIYRALSRLEIDVERAARLRGLAADFLALEDRSRALKFSKLNQISA